MQPSEQARHLRATMLVAAVPLPSVQTNQLRSHSCWAPRVRRLHAARTKRSVCLRNMPTAVRPRHMTQTHNTWARGGCGWLRCRRSHGGSSARQHHECTHAGTREACHHERTTVGGTHSTRRASDAEGGPSAAARETASMPGGAPCKAPITSCVSRQDPCSGHRGQGSSTVHHAAALSRQAQDSRADKNFRM